MKRVLVTLASASPYSQGRHHDTEKLPKERPDAYEKRTYRNKLHVDPKTGHVLIPQMAFKNCLSEAAKFLSIQIPGKNKATFTKHFEAGVLCLTPMKLNIKAQDVPAEELFVPSDGKRGGGKRVMKIFPTIQEWEGQIEFHILDETITEEVFLKHLEEAGKFIGIGRFRPRNNGFYGRFEIKSAKWL